MVEKMVTIQEFDESDRLSSTYVSSEGKVHYIKQKDVRENGIHKVKYKHAL